MSDKIGKVSKEILRKRGRKLTTPEVAEIEGKKCRVAEVRNALVELVAEGKIEAFEYEGEVYYGRFTEPEEEDHGEEYP